MNKLSTGEFYGEHYKKSAFDNIVITDTEYIHEKVDWHYHENPYFTYLLEGQLFESNKKESYYLEQGDLLFHNWQDAHYNVKPPSFTRGFHIELNINWLINFGVKIGKAEGSLQIKDPVVKNLMNQIFMETKIGDQFSTIGVESALVDILSSMNNSKSANTKKPIWAKKLQEVLWEEKCDYSLDSLGRVLGIHPVHLSRNFNRYFGTSLGNYIRLLKLNKAFCLITTKKYSMTEVCYQCGFYDQSHFISNFKRVYKKTPTQLLKEMSQG